MVQYGCWPVQLRIQRIRTGVDCYGQLFHRVAPHPDPTPPIQSPSAIKKKKPDLAKDCRSLASLTSKPTLLVTEMVIRMWWYSELNMISNESKRTDPTTQTKRSKWRMEKSGLIRCYFRVSSPLGEKNMKGNLLLWCSYAMLPPEKRQSFF